MKINNSTDWSDAFLRRMTVWCMKQVGMPVRYMRAATFRNRQTTSFSGHACPWSRNIVVSIGVDRFFPRSVSTHGEGVWFNDRVEALVAVTAHEVFHVEAERKGSVHYQNTRGSGRGSGSSEAVTCKVEIELLNAFRKQRVELIVAWSQVEKPEPDKNEQALLKTEKDLARWYRKFALAKTKVRKLEARLKRLQTPKPPKPVCEPKPRKVVESIEAVAARHGIQIDEHVNRGEYFVYPPPQLDSEGKDRYYGDHFVFNRSEMRQRVA